MAAKKEARSFGWAPLVIMSAVYVLCTYFRDTIGPLTSAPGFYRISEETPEPRRGCIIPRASP